MPKQGNTINPILDAMLESRSADGVALFERMTEPTPEDQCWAGQCLVILDRAQEGLLLLSQAAAHGFDDALPFVAGAYNVLGEVESMHSTLNGIDLARLSPFAKACAVRDRGLLEYIEDRMPQALAAFEQAWALANADPVGRRAMRWFDMPLGLLHAELGRDQRALVYLDRAIKGNSTAHLLGLRALSLIYLGRLEDAAADLKLARQDHLHRHCLRQPLNVFRVYSTWCVVYKTMRCIICSRPLHWLERKEISKQSSSPA